HQPPLPFPTRRSSDLPTDKNTPRQDCDERHILSFFLEKAGTSSNAKLSRMCSKGSSGWHETCYFAQKSDRNRVGYSKQTRCQNRSAEHTSELQSREKL